MSDIRTRKGPATAPAAVDQAASAAGPRPAARREPVSVIVPAFNEEAGVGSQVDSLRRALQPLDVPFEIIVIDDGSTDQTAAAAARASARVIRHLANRGYGASIKTGILAARFDIIVMSDADGTYPADQIPILLENLETADMAVGARVGAEVHIPLARRPAKWVLTRLASQVAGCAIPDLNSGLRAFRRECILQYFPILSNRFSFTTTSTLSLLADDYRIVYTPINYYPRTGQSKVTPRHFMEFVMLVLKITMMFQPLKIFLLWALTLGGLGLLKTVYDVIALFLRHDRIDWTLLYQPVLSTSAT
ncbi:MAG TPA: glycosyltransferase family 2 protein, partial [Dehalococcoidia bacterium]|nr:glycosyltransferase family 2 protein [Dehalococcoidia bacterium]